MSLFGDLIPTHWKVYSANYYSTGMYCRYTPLCLYLVRHNTFVTSVTRGPWAHITIPQVRAEGQLAPLIVGAAWQEVAVAPLDVTAAVQVAAVAPLEVAAAVQAAAPLEVAAAVPCWHVCSLGGWFIVLQSPPVVRHWLRRMSVRGCCLWPALRAGVCLLEIVLGTANNGGGI